MESGANVQQNLRQEFPADRLKALYLWLSTEAEPDDFSLEDWLLPPKDAVEAYQAAASLSLADRVAFVLTREFGPKAFARPAFQWLSKKVVSRLEQGARAQVA
jgi:hypothetical protein